MVKDRATSIRELTAETLYGTCRRPELVRVPDT
jgi:hypothetical protein